MRLFFLRPSISCFCFLIHLGDVPTAMEEVSDCVLACDTVSLACAPAPLLGIVILCFCYVLLVVSNWVLDVNGLPTPSPGCKRRYTLETDRDGPRSKQGMF